MINYSFIIPHKNCPDLLQRCVDSIPERDDVQIIVVDDNRNEGKKPQISRKGIEVILLDAEQSKGAGRARNVGLEHAKGKWLLFADCDDYYVSGFLDVLDNYRDEQVDVLYFNATQLHFSGKPVKSSLNKAIEDYFTEHTTNSLDFLKYRIHSPWNKMARKSFIDNYNILFEEVPNGNDTMFSYQVGFFAKKLEVISDKLYIYTMNRKSITHRRRTSAILLSYLCNQRKQMRFSEFVGHKEWCREIDFKNYLKRLVKSLNIVDAFRVTYLYFSKKKIISSEENMYVDLIKRRL